MPIPQMGISHFELLKIISNSNSKFHEGMARKHPTGLKDRKKIQMKVRKFFHTNLQSPIFFIPIFLNFFFLGIYANSTH
jgi:hypothetical protein